MCPHVERPRRESELRPHKTSAKGCEKPSSRFCRLEGTLNYMLMFLNTAENLQQVSRRGTTVAGTEGLRTVRSNVKLYLNRTS
jgi:hypothetical protein